MVRRISEQPVIAGLSDNRMTINLSSVKLEKKVSILEGVLFYASDRKRNSQTIKKQIMYYLEDCTYHIFNRSNETVFYNRDNYLFFLRKIREHILPCANILSYCLMPNHFHLILNIKPEGVVLLENKKMEDMQVLSRAIGTILSSYTQALNKQQGRRGSLFAHKTKANILNDAENEYALNCFMYIHQNPLLAKLVDKIEDWEFSSYLDYIGNRKGTLVNKQLGFDIFQVGKNQIYDLTYILLKDKFDEDFL